MRRWRGWLLAGAAVSLCAAMAIGSIPAVAQIVSFPPRPKPEVRHGPVNGQMLVQADEIQYDYANERVAAVGNVQIYYNNSTLEADKIIYDQKTKRLHAEGNARLTDASGMVTLGDVMELSDDYRDGFVDSLRIEMPEQTRIAAARANRSGGQFSVFQSGVYTACEPCKDDPKKPPLWQVRAARIIHDQKEKMIYFEDGTFDLYGFPIAYFPYFSAPDPTVKRKSGILAPTGGSSSRVGLWARVPYFWAIAPDYDLTVTPTITTRQGPLLEMEWRQRLVNGSYFIRGSGIFQQDPHAFDATAPFGTTNTFRGAIESSGLFAINDKWAWGWDLIAPRDRLYFSDYSLLAPLQGIDLLRSTPSEGISDIFLTGRGDRSYFDARSIYFYGFSTADSQARIPTIHPVIDYDYVFGDPIYGGELGFKTNLTSLTRSNASFDPISQTAFLTGACAATTADPAAKQPNNCLLRGIPGDYTRFSAEMTWRRTFTDSFGQMFIPFASLRADAAHVAIRNDTGVSNFIPVGDSDLTRVMPTAGVEYRYPFIGVESWGTQTIEPIAQLIVRPDETDIGRFPNEDSQSLIFDDSNLFKIDKFSGWDRVEGGGRANVGVRYTAQFNRAGTFETLFGQSYQLFGTNSFAVGDLTNTGINSGLDTDRSDYVARVSYRPSAYLNLTTRYRFDHDDFAIRRFEAEANLSFERWGLTVLYGNYDPQPALGFLTQRQGINTVARLKLSREWALLGGALYDLDEGKLIGTNVGVGYINDCIIIALNYIRGYNYVVGQQDTQTVMLQVQLRTLGALGTNQRIGNPNGT